MNYDTWRSTDPTDTEDYRGPCAECGDPCEGIWCASCLQRWREQEVTERKQRAVSAAPLREKRTA